MKAATLEIDVIIGELTRLQSDLSAVKRGVNETMGEAVRAHQLAEKSAAKFAEQLEREASVLGKTAAEVRKMDIAARAAAADSAGFNGLALRIRSAGAALDITTASAQKQGMAVRQTLLQMPDIVTGLATGQKPLQVLLQQGGQLFQVAQMAEGGVAGFAKEVGSFALRFVPAIAAVGALYAGLELVKSGLNDDAGLKKYADGLGLTHKEMEKLQDVGITTGDIMVGIWRTLNADTSLGDFIDRAKGEFATLRDSVVGSMRAAAANIGGALIGSYYAVVEAWKSFPAAINSAVIDGLNKGAAFVGELINAAIDGINALGGHLQAFKPNFIKNDYEAAGADVAGAYAKGFSIGYQAVDNTIVATAKNIEQAARDRLKRQADEISYDRRAAEAAAAKRKADREAEKAAKEAFEQLERFRKARDDYHYDSAQDTLKATAAWNKVGDLGPDINAPKMTTWVEDLQRIGQQLEANSPLQKLNDEIADQLNLWDDLAQRAGEAASNMERAFGRVGGAIGEVTRTLAEYGARQAQIDKQKEAAAGDQAKLDRLGKQSADLQLSTTIGLIGAAKGLFNERSKGYKAMEAAEKALTIVQLARTAVDVAGGAARMFASLGPWAFPAIAAMVGVMASLGFSSGGGGTSSADYSRGNVGSGSVLGASDAKSESVKNAIDLLRSVDDATLSVSRDMLNSLRSIESQIGGVASLLVRTGNIDGASAGVNEGFNRNAVGDVLSKAPFAVFGAAGVALSGLVEKIPVIGDILGGLGNLVGGLFGTKTKVVGSGLYADQQSLSDILGGGFDLETYADVQKKKKFLGLTSSTKYSTQYGEADAGLGDQFTLILRSFNDAITAAAGPLGVATGDIENRLSGFIVDLGKVDFTGLSGDEITDKLNAVFGAAADDMAAAAIPGLDRFQQVGEGAFETLVRVASTVEQVDAVFRRLGTTSGSMGVDVDMAVAGMFDSVSDFTSAANAYFEAFYTPAEQAAAKTAEIGRAFGALGMAMPDTLAGFRQLVEAQDLTSAAGQQTYATLLQLAPAFADLKGEMDETVSSARSAADILSERRDLERQILQLTGDTAAIRTLDLAKLDDSNRALQMHVWALTDQAAAADAATKAAKDAATAQAALDQAATARAAAIAQERDGLVQQVWQAQGDEASIRAVQLASLDESNRGLQLLVYALADQKAATDAAAQAAATAAQAEQALAGQRTGIENQILQLQGDTAAIRARELAALDPSLRALQERYYALQDQQAADATAAQAAQDAAQAAQQLADAWSSIGDSIMDEVKRIRGLTDAGSANSFAALQGQFNAATEAARAGNQDAAKSLPEMSKSLLDAAALVAASRQELARIQSQTAASLEDTASLIGLGLFGSNDNASTAAAWASGAASAATSDTDAASELRSLRTELTALREEMAGMRADNNAGNAQIAGNTGSIKRTLENVTEDGNAITTVAA